jgi:hypothetical protein
MNPESSVHMCRRKISNNAYAVRLPRSTWL